MLISRVVTLEPGNVGKRWVPTDHQCPALTQRRVGRLFYRLSLSMGILRIIGLRTPAGYLAHFPRIYSWAKHMCSHFHQQPLSCWTTTYL